MNHRISCLQGSILLCATLTFWSEKSAAQTLTPAITVTGGIAGDALVPSVNCVAGGCLFAGSSAALYDQLAAANLTGSLFNFQVPDDSPRSADTNPVKVIFIPPGGPGTARSVISSATCAGATFTGIGTTLLTVSLPPDQQCSLTITSPNGAGGALMQFVAQLRRTETLGGVKVYTVSPGTVTGDAFGGTVAVPGSPSSTSASRVQQTQRLISNFLSRRADQITANDPDLWTRLVEKSSGGEGEAPVNVTGSSELGNSNIAFSTSLRQMANAGEARKMASLGEDGSKMGLGLKSNAASASQAYGFDAWVQGSWVRTDSESAESDLGLFYVGAEYRVNRSLLFGVLGQFDWTDEANDFQQADIEGRGWMFGPYVVARLHQNLIFDSRAAWGQSDNDISLDRTSTDNFDTNRWLLKGQFTGDFEYGQWHFAPHIGVIYFEDDQKSYIDSNGLLIGSQKASLGRVSFGPRVSKTYDFGDITLAPYVDFKGMWDFNRTNIVDITTGFTFGTEEFRGRVEGGAVITIDGVTFTGEGFYDGLGATDFSAYGGKARLSVPLN